MSSIEQRGAELAEALKSGDIEQAQGILRLEVYRDTHRTPETNAVIAMAAQYDPDAASQLKISDNGTLTIVDSGCNGREIGFVGKMVKHSSHVGPSPYDGEPDYPSREEQRQERHARQAYHHSVHAAQAEYQPDYYPSQESQYQTAQTYEPSQPYYPTDNPGYQYQPNRYDSGLREFGTGVLLGTVFGGVLSGLLTHGHRHGWNGNWSHVYGSPWSGGYGGYGWGGYQYGYRRW